MSLRGDFWSFSEDGKEFSFTRRDHKNPWRNLIFTDQLKSSFTQTGAGAVFDRSPVNDCLCPDNNPRLVAVRDQESGAVWTINGVDSAKQPADWKCTHGFGYTRINSKTAGIAGSVTYFVPVDEATEIWQIRLENTSNRPRALRVFPCVLWRFGLTGYETGFDDVCFSDNMIIGKCPYRGSVYNITIEAPEGVSKRVKELYVDGKSVAGNLIPILPPGREANIRVVVGA